MSCWSRFLYNIQISRFMIFILQANVKNLKSKLNRDWKDINMTNIFYMIQKSPIALVFLLSLSFAQLNQCNGRHRLEESLPKTLTDE